MTDLFVFDLLPFFNLRSVLAALPALKTKSLFQFHQKKSQIKTKQSKERQSVLVQGERETRRKQ